MQRIRLIHWKAVEVKERAQRLRAAGYEVDSSPVGPADLKRLRKDPPAAVVIDLSRLPSHGRDIALVFRETKATRNIPLIFVDGESEKVARIRSLLPDAVYSTWGRIRGALKKAIDQPAIEPIVQRTRMDGYSGTPLPKKLGIKEDHVVTLINAPRGFEKTLVDRPTGVVFQRIERAALIGNALRNTSGKSARLRKAPSDTGDLVLWFVTSRGTLERNIGVVARRCPADGAWIIWPKKASGMQTDVTQNDVRKLGLASGLVDYKICAVDATWSGLKFCRRKT